MKEKASTKHNSESWMDGYRAAAAVSSGTHGLWVWRDPLLTPERCKCALKQPAKHGELGGEPGGSKGRCLFEGGTSIKKRKGCRG